MISSIRRENHKTTQRESKKVLVKSVAQMKEEKEKLVAAFLHANLQLCKLCNPFAQCRPQWRHRITLFPSHGQKIFISVRQFCPLSFHAYSTR
jgi:hypothetical protein